MSEHVRKGSSLQKEVKQRAMANRSDIQWQPSPIATAMKTLHIPFYSSSESSNVFFSPVASTIEPRFFALASEVALPLALPFPFFPFPLPSLPSLPSLPLPLLSLPFPFPSPAFSTPIYRPPYSVSLNLMAASTPSADLYFMNAIPRGLPFSFNGSLRLSISPHSEKSFRTLSSVTEK